MNKLNCRCIIINTPGVVMNRNRELNMLLFIRMGKPSIFYRSIKIRNVFLFSDLEFNS